MTEPIAPAADLAAGLRALADDIESGRRPVPLRGIGLRQVNGAPVVPLAVHDALCGWQVASLQEDGGKPLVQACHGCGLAYLQSEAKAKPEDGDR